MKAGIYVPCNNAFHQEVLAAFTEGLRRHGVEIHAMPLEMFDGREMFDFAVVYGIGKMAVPYSRLRENVRSAYHACNKRCIVLERGYIKRDQYHAAGCRGQPQYQRQF